MITFEEFVRLREGGFIADEKAEEGKSRPKKPMLRTPSSVTTYGISGGPGGYTSGTAATPVGQNAKPIAK